jgi:TonB family protein
MLSDSMKISKPRHCDELDSTVKLAAVVDASGIPHDVRTLETSYASLGDFGVGYIESEEFNPGLYNGVPSAVAVAITLELKTCIQFREGSDDKKDAVVLKVPPVQSIAIRSAPDATGPIRPFTVGGRISAPIPISDPDPHYSIYGRKRRIQGICLVGLIVDPNGIPQNVHVVKSLEPSLDQNAIEAVNTWRFKPALKDGSEPVPVMITVEVSFLLR